MNAAQASPNDSVEVMLSIGEIAAVAAALGTFGTIGAVLYQVSVVRHEARMARTVSLLEQFQVTLRQVREFRNYELPPVFEAHDPKTFNAAVEMLHAATSLAIAYETRGSLDRSLVEHTLRPSYEWLRPAHGSVPQNIPVSEGRFPEVGRLLNQIKPK